MLLDMIKSLQIKDLFERDLILSRPKVALCVLLQSICNQFCIVTPPALAKKSGGLSKSQLETGSYAVGKRHTVSQVHQMLLCAEQKNKPEAFSGHVCEEH